jgi:hypothetical protein
MSSETDRQGEESRFLFIARPSGIASVDPGYLQPRYRRQITVGHVAEAQPAMLQNFFITGQHMIVVLVATVNGTPF